MKGKIMLLMVLAISNLGWALLWMNYKPTGSETMADFKPVIHMVSSVDTIRQGERHLFSAIGAYHSIGEPMSAIEVKCGSPHLHFLDNAYLSYPEENQVDGVLFANDSLFRDTCYSIWHRVSAIFYLPNGTQDTLWDSLEIPVAPRSRG